jgi:hypothetical protein
MADHTRVTLPLAVAIPDGMLTLIAYLTGYHPSGRLAALLADEHGDWAIATYELDDPQLLPHLIGCAHRRRLPLIFLASYSPLDAAADHIRAVGAGVRGEGLTVVGQVQVNRGHYRSLDGVQDVWGDWQRAEPDTLVAAEMVVQGRAVLADREQLAAQYAPATGPARDRMTAATAIAQRFWDQQHRHDQATARRALRAISLRHLDQIDDHLRSEPTQALGLDDMDVALLGIGLRDETVLNAALLRADRDRGYRQVWAQIARRVDHADLPAPATIAAFTCWRCGNAETAAIALHHALTADPAYPLARLLHAGVTAGPPAPSWAHLTRPSAADIDPH